MGTVGMQVLHACVHQKGSDHVNRGCRVKGLFPPAGILQQISCGPPPTYAVTLCPSIYASFCHLLDRIVYKLWVLCRAYSLWFICSFLRWGSLVAVRNLL